ncbi:hypothetical protein OG194_26310 [Streptomyces sp. NBC_01288]|uniref:hypothetical protein n=1 Tax=Streptomyces sp. NBC_01288 TaxID=2903814 RepID=UPI002E1621D8|nr:hypothetical protein OG194_26310 [Streptomyces sp. NBC_01288]
MTQSGQGEEPSARPAREGIVLPSDGGAPLLPGMTGGRGDQQSGGQPSIAPPTSGQSWGGSWGPDQHDQHQHRTPAPPPGQGWGDPQQQQPQQPAQQWGAAPEQPAPSPWGAQDGIPGQSGALPQESDRHAAYGVQQQSYAQEYPSGYAQEPAAGYVGAGYASDQSPAIPQGAAQNYGYGYGTSGSDAHQQSSGAAPLPTAAPAFPSAPLPPADEGATQYIPPVVNVPGDEGATQFLPPVTAAGMAAMDEGATQYIPPVGPGALPPEMPAGPMPQAAYPDAQPTQFLPPVPAQGAAPGYGARPGGPDDRQPPAEFDNLFRNDAGGEQPAASTQQMPRFQQPPRAEQPGQQGYGQAQPPYAQPSYAQPSYAPPGDGGGRRGAQGDDGGRGGRRSRVPLIAGVGVGIAILGVGAGALLSGGGGKSDDANKTVAATSAATDGSSSAGTDAAKEQAVALDKLLADSGSSRASVIKAVGNVKACDKLGDSASDLRDAAKQRAELVTKLSQLTVDKLPDNAALTTALTNAWKASASADNHYAAWADQAAGKKGCKKGQARTTGQTAAGNAASGVASNQKVKAAALWNTIAKTYGLTQRQPTQL